MVIAEDDVLVRDILITFLSTRFDSLRCVAGVSTFEEAVAACIGFKAHLLVLRLLLLGPSGENVIAELRKRLPKLNILLYSGTAARNMDVIRAIRSPANGHVGKTATLAEFIEAIERTLTGKSYFCRGSNRLLAEIASGRHSPKSGVSDLSPRETQILRLIAEGRTNKEIADLLRLSVATVDTHRRNLMTKAKAHNAAELIRYGHEFQLLAPLI